MGKNKLHKRSKPSGDKPKIISGEVSETDITDRTMNAVEQEEIDEDNERAERLLHDMITSVNFVILLSIITVVFIGLSMVITMLVLGVNENTKRKHVFGFPN